MSKKFNGFDDLFRNTLSDFELSENKANWEDLNHLLDTRRKKKIRLILVAFLLLLILPVAYLIFLPSKEKITNSVFTNRNSKEVTESVYPSVSDSFNSESTEKSKNNFEKSGLQNIPSPSEEKNVVRNEVKKNTDELTQIDTRTLNDQQIIVLSENKNAKTTQLLPLNSSAIEKADSATELVSSDLPSKYNSDASDSLTSKPEYTESSGIATKNNSSINSNPIEKADSTSEAINSDLSSKHNLAVSDSLTSKSQYIDSSGIATKNTSPADTIAPNEINASKSSRLSLNFYAGLNFYSTNSAAFTSQMNISPLVGFELKRFWSPHFSVGLGVLYALQGGYHLADTVTLESYFLDQNISQEIIDIRQLHKLYFPLTFYYNPADRHAFSFSIQGSYLINTNGDYSEIYQTSGINNHKQVINAKGYMDGIKSVNVALSLGYNFSLAKRFELGARITRELTDPYTPAHFYGVDARPSWSLQTFLIVKFD